MLDKQIDCEHVGCASGDDFMRGVKRLSVKLTEAVTKKPKERKGWANKAEFVLSCMGYAIGIGNVWRFPFLVYKNGGGSFLIPFVIMLITMGIPIFYLEVAVGQYTGLGPFEIYKSLAPAFGGVGICTLIVIALVSIYYMVLMSWILSYIVASFYPKLAWAYCDNDFNTPECYSQLQDMECQQRNSSMIFFNKTCLSIKDVCLKFGYLDGDKNENCHDGDKIVPLKSLYKRILSSEQYFNDYALGVNGATWDNFGTINWQLFLYLSLGWIIVFVCLSRGVKSAGKVAYFTALFPYVMLTAVLIRGVTLDGAIDGISYFIIPKFETLKNASVWGDAASQVFYSLGIGCGSLITMSSFNSFTNNCYRDSLLIATANIFTSVFAGFAIFSILGYLSKQMGMPIEDIAQDGGLSLAFIAYPEAVTQMPWSNLWAVLFFIMLFILGLGSQFPGVQAVSTAIIDAKPSLREKEGRVIFFVCFCGWLMGLPMIFSGGVYLYKLMDWNTASWAVLLIGIFEIIVPCWFYGCDKFIKNIGEMKMYFNKFSYFYWWINWVIIAPATCLGIFIYQMIMYEPVTYGAYKFPSWANFIGILIGLSTLAPLPIYFIYRVYKGPRNMSLFKVTKNWGPSNKSEWQT
ncbi:sodium- and chloride-dependent glycine transporter 2-like [Microplitis mediator]|uniref:sodium- and chloride-dependent glycine transporter 2-like n=1 Tax=Microplitis mediator TaxID=375433 RepID=UPI0025578641|nr:sodium- and chloride-dependent glycine transporter 2-like [Microplitis mediator]